MDDHAQGVPVASKVDAATVLFPVAVADRIGPVTPPDLAPSLWRLNLRQPRSWNLGLGWGIRIGNCVAMTYHAAIQESL